ncbi:MAG: hypothetical protein UT09_C0006G0027 [Parcubacteria group bacterium GW2011_GWF2_38_8]|nr:MAG: hypothetical protein UT09_C0006G0027 [Parcubacteria group bacterium GW2011_GWF2_38_8]
MKIFGRKFFFQWLLVTGFFLFLFFFVINKQNTQNTLISGVPIKNNQIDSLQENNLNFNKIQYVKIAGKIIKVELATTPDSWQKGLSGREKLKEDEGMLFVFNHTGQYSFWMKDMNFPIDIIWLAPSRSGDGENLRVVGIKKNALPTSYPETYIPDVASKYVLEVISGFSEKNNLKEGDEMKFLP